MQDKQNLSKQKHFPFLKDDITTSVWEEKEVIQLLTLIKHLESVRNKSALELKQLN
jgi:hypothetical protein